MSCEHEYEFAEKLVELDQRSKSNCHRIDEVEKRQDNLDKLVASVSILKTEQEHIQSDVQEIKHDVKGMMSAPGKRWDGLMDKLIAAVAGAFLAWLVTGAQGL